MDEYLILDITYYLNEEKFDFMGDIKKERHSSVIETFLRGQMGKDADKSEPNDRETYHINMKWYPSNDTIKVSDDAGNRGLRDGILMQTLEYLGKKKK